MASRRALARPIGVDDVPAEYRTFGPGDSPPGDSPCASPPGSIPLARWCTAPAVMHSKNEARSTHDGSSRNRSASGTAPSTNGGVSLAPRSAEEKEAAAADRIHPSASAPGTHSAASMRRISASASASASAPLGTPASAPLGTVSAFTSASAASRTAASASCVVVDLCCPSRHSRLSRGSRPSSAASITLRKRHRPVPCASLSAAGSAALPPPWNASRHHPATCSSVQQYVRWKTGTTTGHPSSSVPSPPNSAP